jgi:hypothetical protein
VCARARAVVVVVVVVVVVCDCSSSKERGGSRRSSSLTPREEREAEMRRAIATVPTRVEDIEARVAKGPHAARE